MISDIADLNDCCDHENPVGYRRGPVARLPPLGFCLVQVVAGLMTFASLQVLVFDELESYQAVR